MKNYLINFKILLLVILTSFLFYNIVLGSDNNPKWKIELIGDKTFSKDDVVCDLHKYKSTDYVKEDNPGCEHYRLLNDIGAPKTGEDLLKGLTTKIIVPINKIKDIEFTLGKCSVYNKNEDYNPKKTEKDLYIEISSSFLDDLKNNEIKNKIERIDNCLNDGKNTFEIIINKGQNNEKRKNYSFINIKNSQTKQDEDIKKTEDNTEDNTENIEQIEEVEENIYDDSYLLDNIGTIELSEAQNKEYNNDCKSLHGIKSKSYNILDTKGQIICICKKGYYMNKESNTCKEIPKIKENKEPKTKIENTPINAANSLAKNKIIKDYSSDTEKYNIDGYISRKEAIKIVLNLSSLKVQKNCDGIFSDVDKNDWGCGYIESALNYGLIKKNEKFRPNEKITEAEILKMLLKSVNIKKDDNYDDWAEGYKQIAIKENFIDENKEISKTEYAKRGLVFTISYAILSND